MRETASQFITRLSTLRTNNSDLDSILRRINSFNRLNGFPIINITQLKEFYGYIMEPPPGTMSKLESLPIGKQVILTKLSAGPGLSCTSIIERQYSNKLALIVVPFEVDSGLSPGYRIDSAKDATVIGVQIPAHQSLSRMREALNSANVPLSDRFDRALTHLHNTHRVSSSTRSGALQPTSARTTDAQSGTGMASSAASTEAFAGLQRGFLLPKHKAG